MAEFTTILKDLEVRMRLGIHPHEVAPQRVSLSVWITIAYPDPLGADAITQVLDYDFVREGIHAMAAGEGFALQETLCEAVVALCLSDARVRAVRVRSMKLDVYPDAAVGCEVIRKRQITRPDDPESDPTPAVSRRCRSCGAGSTRAAR